VTWQGKFFCSVWTCFCIVIVASYTAKLAGTTYIYWWVGAWCRVFKFFSDIGRLWVEVVMYI
jgi:hypothetical protein